MKKSKWKVLPHVYHGACIKWGLNTYLKVDKVVERHTYIPTEEDWDGYEHPLPERELCEMHCVVVNPYSIECKNVLIEDIDSYEYIDNDEFNSQLVKTSVRLKNYIN